MKRLKSFSLFLMVILSLYLSSIIWLDLPDFLSFNKSDYEDIESDNRDIEKMVWELVKPHKYMLKNEFGLRQIQIKNDHLLWQNALSSLENALAKISESQTNLLAGEFYPTEYVAMEFENKLPTEIFAGKFQIDTGNIMTKLRNIDKIVFGLNEVNSIYILTGNTTVKIKSTSIDNTDIYKSLKDIDEAEFLVYKENIQIEGETLSVAVPDINTALNPLFVKSELDIKNKATIEAIAKDYFKNTFDYVRRTEDIDGYIRYVYKNEKVLKISPEGLLDFYNPNVDIVNTSNVYTGFLSAIQFASNFLDFQTDMYLSDVKSIQHEGSFGYNFIFTYRIKNKPILFSKIRESAALEVKVIGDSVVSYKRLIRDLDTNQSSDKMKEQEIMSFENLLKKQLIVNENEEGNVLRVIDKSMIKDINNVYLAYFDYARKINEQQLIVVWVIEINDEMFVFNAITGNLMER